MARINAILMFPRPSNQREPRFAASLVLGAVAALDAIGLYLTRVDIKTSCIQLEGVASAEGVFGPEDAIGLIQGRIAETKGHPILGDVDFDLGRCSYDEEPFDVFPVGEPDGF